MSTDVVIRTGPPPRRRAAWALLLAIAAVGACRDGGRDAEQRAARSGTDPVDEAAATDVHAGHSMGDSAPAEATGSATGPILTAAPGGHGAHAAGAEAAAAPAPGSGGHAGHAAGAGGGGDARTASTAIAADAHTDHAVGAGLAAPGGVDARGAGQAAHAGHAADAASPIPTAPAQAAAGHGMHAARPADATSPGSEATDRGTEKLRTLVAELLRDTLVQREIEQDPTLRELWSDEGVRSAVTGTGN